MSSLPSITSRQCIRALERAGFLLKRIKGSHHHYTHPVHHGRVVPVPIHGGDLKKGTLRSIIKQAGMTVEEFVDLL